jgi:SAM-dependent methyltransferase
LRVTKTVGVLTLEDRLAQLWSLAHEIYAQRPDLQEAFPEVQSEEFWIWLNCFGIKEYQTVCDLLVPIPPPPVRAFAGDIKEEAFLLTGASIYRLLTQVAQEQGRPLSSFDAILDFGCGPGRGLRYLLRYAQTVVYSGTDVDATAMRWCQTHFPFGEFAVNNEVPPTDFRSEIFGLIYAISVFSHLSEENHLAWLEELQRVAKKDGFIVLTIHGEHALRRAVGEEAVFRMLSIKEADLVQAQQELPSRQYVFIRQPGGRLNNDLYGITFISKAYVLRHWGQDFEILSYWEGAIDNWQDAVVLRMKR